jgi:hypothetical protein
VTTSIGWECPGQMEKIGELEFLFVGGFRHGHIPSQTTWFLGQRDRRFAAGPIQGARRWADLGKLRDISRQLTAPDEAEFPCAVQN